MKEAIQEICIELEDFLLKKNKSYGNSAADPLMIFSKLDPIARINVRIDDKISRLARGEEYPGEDTELDLLGYLILKRVISRNEENKRAEIIQQKINLAKRGQCG